ncbi:hypothetical protein P7K49_002394 [Saguinus oedipus]|uniref:Basic proline-rich protein-like n=1 Tax=Saguinus oedipus TaxID=9490 RepID=A0ABQ9WH87_SAGOE|nr:hypothetical protein P7K49_002394 [Saguinus oedipus]
MGSCPFPEPSPLALVPPKMSSPGAPLGPEYSPPPMETGSSARPDRLSSGRGAQRGGPERARAPPRTSAPASRPQRPDRRGDPSPPRPLVSQPAAHSFRPRRRFHSRLRPGSRSHYGCEARPAQTPSGRFCRQPQTHRPRRSRWALPIGCRTSSPAPHHLRRPRLGHQRTEAARSVCARGNAPGCALDSLPGAGVLRFRRHPEVEGSAGQHRT